MFSKPCGININDPELPNCQGDATISVQLGEGEDRVWLDACQPCHGAVAGVIYDTKGV